MIAAPLRRSYKRLLLSDLAPNKELLRKQAIVSKLDYALVCDETSSCGCGLSLKNTVCAYPLQNFNWDFAIVLYRFKNLLAQSAVALSLLKNLFAQFVVTLSQLKNLIAQVTAILFNFKFLFAKFVIVLFYFRKSFAEFALRLIDCFLSAQLWRAPRTAWWLMLKAYALHKIDCLKYNIIKLKCCFNCFFNLFWLHLFR